MSARPGPLQRTAAVWRYRELLMNLVRKELKVKYKKSVLGFVWSLLNPALYLVVFYVVFQLILKNGIPSYAIFLLAGLLPWNLFSTALSAGTVSITTNASLVGKVWFPREILPLAAIGAALVHYFLQSMVLVVALVVFRWVPSAGYAVALVPALLAFLALIAALSIALAAINVYLRDTQHLLELALLAWFWLTPIVYPYQLIANKLGSLRGLALLNPVTPTIITFQRVVYNRTTVDHGTKQILPPESLLWYLRNLGITLAAAAALLFVALAVFGRLEDNFAEEI